MKKNKIIKTTNSSPIAEYVQLSDDLIDITDIMENYSQTFTDLRKHDIKDGNPKDSVGVKKVPLHVVSCPVLMELGLAMMEGDRKYGGHNYRVAGVRASVYYDATMRHMMSWWEGQDIDEDSKLSHVTKAISSLMVLRDAMINDMWNDDRPPKVKNQDWIKDYNEKAKAIIEKYPNPVKPFTEK